MRKNKPEIVADVTEKYDLKFRIPNLLRATLVQIGANNPVRVDIARWYKKRSPKQNSYLWGVVYPYIIRYIKDKTGQTFTAEDLHERYKRKFLGYERCSMDGMQDLIRVKSSTELNTKEFSDDLVEHICREWAENGLYIPLPGEE